MRSIDENQGSLPESRRLFPRELVLLFGITFLAYANISVFFRFYGYLDTLPIDPKWFGLVIGVFSAASLIARPFVSSFFHAGNARPYLHIGAAMAILSLAAYTLAQGFWGMFLVRAFHGLAFVVLGAALMTVIIDFIPKERSGQAFGLLSIIILAPNTMIPPLLPMLNQTLGGFTHVLLFFAAFLLLIFPLAVFVRPKGKFPGETDVTGSLGWREIKKNLRDLRIPLLLAAMLFLYCGHALVFFFLDGYGRSIGIAATGLFLTLATLSEITVRVAAGSSFDRINKTHLVTAAMVGLSIGYLALAHVDGRVAFFGLGAVLGLGWGVAMPVFNGLLFDLSLPQYRAFNTNLGLQMFQGGFFFGPFIGGTVVDHSGFTALFYLCALFSLFSAILAYSLDLFRQKNLIEAVNVKDTREDGMRGKGGFLHRPTEGS
jgi:predicted MFS family arabinose efflux permease